jgi:hypothetical protein
LFDRGNQRSYCGALNREGRRVVPHPHLLRTIAFSAVAVLWAGSASAVTFDGGYAVTLHTSTSGGTAVAESDIAANPFNFDLNNVNDSVNFNLFNITIAENIDESDDFISNPIAVNFAFTLPDIGGGTVTGTTTGQATPVTIDHGLYISTQLNVAWDGPIDVDFNGIGLRIALSDIVIDCSYKNCKDRVGAVSANFLLTALPVETTYASVVEAAAIATPLPAALPMFAAGVGLIGGLGYRRRRKAKGRAA